MKISDFMPSSLVPLTHPPAGRAATAVGTRIDIGADAADDAYKVQISPQAREASLVFDKGERSSMPSSSSEAVSPSPTYGAKGVGAVECQTCENRRYKDDSDDSSVSFQTATRIAPGAEESMVRAHEQEHVSHEKVRAKENGGEVVSQNVVIHYQTCPECGRSYVAGGTTTTVTRSNVTKGSGAEGAPEKAGSFNAYA